MRFGHALVLARMLMVFFVRKVLSVGALRSRVVRTLLAVGVVALAVAATGTAYLFLRPVTTDQEVWTLILETATVSALLWTQCAFLFVKVLFLNSESLLELSFHLPLTGRERAVALLVYEAVMVLIVTGAGLFSLTAAAVLILGPAAVLPLVQTIAIPVLAMYGLLSLLYVALLRALERTRLRRVARLVGVLVLFALLLVYSRTLAPLVQEVSRRYLDDDTSFSVVSAPTWFADRFGAPLLISAAIAVLALLTAAVLVLTPRQYVRPSRYLRIRRGSRRALLTPYDRCLLRSSQTWLAALAAAGVLTALCLNPGLNPLWALSLLPMGGFYHFAATEPLRSSGWDRSTPVQVYRQLLRAQLLLLTGGTIVAALVLAAVRPASLADIGPPVAGCLVAAVIATFIGVVFPAEHDNPFSVFLGISATAMVGLVLALAVGILRLDPVVMLLLLILITVVIAMYTVIGIRLDQRRRRHEEIAAGPELRGGRGVAHRSRGGGHAALSHVLDG